MKIEKSINIWEYIKPRFDKYKYVLLICLIGIVLVAWPRSDGQEKQAAGFEGQSDAIKQTVRLQSEIENTFSQIEGVGQVKVVLTLKNGYESVYASDSTISESDSETGSSTNLKTELILAGGSKQEPILRLEKSPSYSGALIVCEGGDNAVIQLTLTQAIKSLIGISADNVVVAKMKK